MIEQPSNLQPTAEPPLTPTNPFAPAESAGQVAGLGKVFRPLFKRFRGTATEESAEEAVERGIAAEATEALAANARRRPTLTPGPKGPYPGLDTELRTGTTRPLPNPDYFDSYETRQVLQLMEKNAARTVAGPVQTHVQTKAKAQTVATLARTAGRAVRGETLNWSPEDLTALRNSMESQAKSLYDLTDELMLIKRNGGTLSTEQLADYEMRSQRLVATRNLVAGVASETARLLNALKIPATDDQGRYVRAMADIVSQGGGPDAVFERIAAVNKTGGDPGKVAKAAEDGRLSKMMQWLLTVRYNVMLSSVRTHAANISGSTITGVYEQAVINPLATIFNLGERSIRRAAGGEFTTADDIPVQAMGAEVRGLLHGARDGILLARDIALGKEVPAESMQGKFITESGMRYRPQDQPQSMVGKIGTLPTRMLEAEDALFRSTYYQGRLEGLAKAKALAENPGDAEAAEAAFRQLLEAPPDEMAAAAREYSQKLTFTNDPNLYGKMLGSLANGVAKMTESGPFRLIIPFVRTPANLLGYSLEAAGLQAITKPSMTAQAVLKGTPRERAEAISRTTAGIGLMMLLHDQWAQGNITGMGAKNYTHVKLMESTGWKANAIRIDDTFYELNRLDPLGLTLAMTASVYEILNDPNMAAEDQMAAIAGATLQLGDLMLDRHYLSTVGDLINAMQSGSVKGLTSIGASTLTSMWLPNIARDFREATDPYRREQAFDPRQPEAGMGTRIWKNVWNALPGYSQKLPVQLDWRGKPILNDGHYLVRGMAPVRLADVKEVPDSTRELLRNGVAPNKPRAQMTIPKASAGSMLKLPLLSLDQGRGFVYSYYQQLVGEHRDKWVSATVEHSAYRKALEKGLHGNPDTPAGRMLSRALEHGADVAKLRFLKQLDKGAEVTLYKGYGDAEVKVQLPRVDTSDMMRAIRDYQRAKPDQREAPQPLIQMPPGGLRNPAVDRIVGF